jgi:nodulation protein E
MVTGGSEAMLCFGGVKAWEGLRVMSKDACRPFSPTATAWCRARARRLRLRGARARHCARRRDPGRGRGLRHDLGRRRYRDALQQGAARAIAGALKDARLDPSSVGYINAHGTGTAANDKTECAAVADAFRDPRRPADDLLDESPCTGT